MATAVFPLQIDQLKTPRLNDGLRAALRVLPAAREEMTTAHQLGAAVALGQTTNARRTSQMSLQRRRYRHHLRATLS